MKKIGLLFIIGIVAMFFLSCGKKYCDCYDPVFNTLNISFSFVDAEGNDLVEGIETGKTDRSHYDAFKGDVVAPDQYTLVSSPDLIEIDRGYSGYYLYPLLGFSAPSENNGYDHYQLGIFVDCPPERDQDEIIYTLTCPYIFGDDAAHQIVTYWRRSSVNPDEYRVCYRLTIDGREITGITYSDNERISYATIVLDR